MILHPFRDQDAEPETPRGRASAIILFALALLVAAIPAFLVGLDGLRRLRDPDHRVAADLHGLWEGFEVELPPTTQPDEGPAPWSPR